MGSSKGYNGGRAYSFLVEPVAIDCNFVVDSTNGNGLGIRSLKGNGVRNVFMHTSATPGSNNGYLNPNPAVGYALIQLRHGYSKYAGGFSGFVSPTTGSSLAINGSALTPGLPYIINAVGHSTLGAATIAPVADVSGSLASTWFRLYDNYGNTFIIWFQVAGVGKAPSGVSGTLVPVQIASGATAAQIGAALVTIIANLPSGIAGVNSFTASGTTTVTVTSTQTNPYSPLPGPPADGAIPTGFTFASTVSATNLKAWQGVGLPTGLTPTVGQGFIATTAGFSSAGSSTGTVMAPGVSGIGSVEVIGDPNTTVFRTSQNNSGFAGSPQSSIYTGGFILVQFLAATSTSVTTVIPTAPAAGSVIGLSFNMEMSSVVISGE